MAKVRRATGISLTRSLKHTIPSMKLKLEADLGKEGREKYQVKLKHRANGVLMDIAIVERETDKVVGACLVRANQCQLKDLIKIKNKLSKMIELCPNSDLLLTSRRSVNLVSARLVRNIDTQYANTKTLEYLDRNINRFTNSGTKVNDNMKFDLSNANILSEVCSITDTKNNNDN